THASGCSERYSRYEKITAPKNSTSVARNVHMPSVLASFCWCRSSNWCATRSWPFPPWMSSCGLAYGASRPARSAPRASTSTALLGAWSGKRHLDLVVRVRLFGHDRHLAEVVRRRRGGRLPLEPGGAPGVVAGALAPPQRPDQIEQRQAVADGEDRRAGRGHRVQHDPGVVGRVG